MMQAHQCVAPGCAAQRLIELRQALLAQAAGGGPGHPGVEQHDAPRPEVGQAADDEGLAVKLAPQGLGVIVVAGDT